MQAIAKRGRRNLTWFLIGLIGLPGGRLVAGADDQAAPLPPGAQAVWDPARAFRETTPSRDRLCINGLWRWQPADGTGGGVPAGGWGFFKVPGCWPGVTDYMQKDAQTVFPHPKWAAARLAGVDSAWYEREVSIPESWAGRRIALEISYLNSLAAVHVDGALVGEVRFPGGALDLTRVCRPGKTHRLSALVTALPLQGLTLSYADTASARQARGRVARRGLCGDLFLVTEPRGPRLADVEVDTSVRQRRIQVSAALQGVEAGASYTLRARVSDGKALVREFRSAAISPADLKDGRASLADEWLPDRLWDLHTPGHTYRLSLALLDAQDRALDVAHELTFGFRELWIDGRDFHLNGPRVFLSSIPFDNAQVSAQAASYAGARESLERLRAIGINMVYTHNYGCEPGTHLGFEEVLRAADDVGMLVSFSMPHFSHYDWKAPDADRANGYARHAAWYVRQARNHPSVVFYSMSHNATGYAEDMNPDLIDGVHDARDRWSSNNVRLARRAEAIVKGIDPTRVVYHHASGNLGPMHVVNFYPNFVPIQELSDWFGHWAAKSVKPVFTCEYGAPFTWDWSMYRGWYKGQREFGGAQVPWEFCLAEWDAQFLGDRAYRISPLEAANIRWEARQLKEGRVWHRWDYPTDLGSPRFDDRHEVLARYTTDNWRAFRAWGVSGISPWEHGHFWTLRPGVDRSRKPLPVDWQHLQRPGFSPDFIGDQYERVDLAFDRDDWVPAASGRALLRNNRPRLAYISGKPGRSTGKDHNLVPGQALEKQLVVINNSRVTTACECMWSLDIPTPLSGSTRIELATGEIAQVPVRFDLPADLKPGTYRLSARVRFDDGEGQDDDFAVQVLPRPTTAGVAGRVALFDPKGETRRLLGELGVEADPVEATADLSGRDLLVIGKGALTFDGPAPRLDRVRDGLKVVVFEQTAEALERRLGFRVQEYGLRQVFPRIMGHPALKGVGPEHLADWSGEATLMPPRLAYELHPRYGPTVRWSGIEVPHLWRCGNRGNVASVLIEKPARGDFRPVVDGGFSLQYAPLLEYREGRGLVVFCQLDVTGRTELDPAARTIAGNLLEYVAGWTAPAVRRAAYAGDPAGLKYLREAGFIIEALDEAPAAGTVLVAAPGAGRALQARAPAVASWLGSGGALLAIGLDAAELGRFLLSPIETTRVEHIAAYFEPFANDSPLAGVGPADVHVRDPRPLPLVTGGARVVGDGVLARLDHANVVFCQVAPWDFQGPARANSRRTHRRLAFLIARLLANAGVPSSTPLLERFASAAPAAGPLRCLDGLYADQPEEWDDPYRHFRW